MKNALMCALTAVAIITGCTDDTGAIRAARAVGLSDVQPTGYRLWGCSEDDNWHTGFKARNARGEIVTGVVCSGWLKGATARFD